jgi:hypothetical protein
MNKLFNKLANIPHDKLLHFFYGTLMAAPLVALTNPLISLAAIIGIAFGKELYDDLSGKGNLELFDALYTIAPVFIMNAVKYI